MTLSPHLHSISLVKSPALSFLMAFALVVFPDVELASATNNLFFGLYDFDYRLRSACTQPTALW